eukprot:493978-Rhodomonas_salina.1
MPSMSLCIVILILWDPVGCSALTIAMWLPGSRSHLSWEDWSYAIIRTDVASGTARERGRSSGDPTSGLRGVQEGPGTPLPGISLRARYVMSGTDMLLRACYALSGTDKAYGATRISTPPSALNGALQVSFAIGLRACYAMPGITIA